MKQYILEHSEWHTRLATFYVQDVDDDKMAVQPGGQTNHPAWILGHLTTDHHFFLTLLGHDGCCDAQWSELFGGGSTPGDDRSKYPSKARLVSALQESESKFSTVLGSMSDEDLAAPVPHERVQLFFPTVGRFALHVAVAEKAFHCGQMSAWRRAMGLTSLFELPDDQMQMLAAT